MEHAVVVNLDLPWLGSAAGNGRLMAPQQFDVGSLEPQAVVPRHGFSYTPIRPLSFSERYVALDGGVSLGAGSTAQVRLAMDLVTGQTVAIKYIAKNRALRQNALREIRYFCLFDTHSRFYLAVCSPFAC